jgi:hypothetical protein
MIQKLFFKTGLGVLFGAAMLMQGCNTSTTTTENAQSDSEAQDSIATAQPIDPKPLVTCFKK